ncbi:hypothetical protein M405DRAFT_833435 [Rhizopogon salebrosus TDB-379]|nr:hypothetical protein M405DRAFT_833435 [Rhizopogon salebrosus TDB-379]
MGGEQEAAPSSIPVNTDLRSPHSSAAIRGSPATKASLLLSVPWSRSLMQGLAGGGHCQLVDEKEEIQC